MRITVFFLLIIMLFSCTERIDNKQTAVIQDSLGYFYVDKAKNFKINGRYDSAYYYFQLAEKKFLQQKDSFSLAKVYFYKALIDYLQHDLPSSENYCVKSLKYLPEDKAYYKKYVYNIFAITALEKKDYASTIEYLKKYRKAYRLEKDTLASFIAYHNNISNAYRDQQLYDSALAHLDTILTVSGLDTLYPKKFARALDNKAHILIKMNKLEEVPKLLDSAYRIRLKIQDELGLIQSHLNYARYYRKVHRKDKSRYHTLKALKLSKDNNIPKNQLESIENLVFLSLPEEKTPVFERYLKLNDSILFEQQKAKDQTARIRFESAEKEREIEAQRQIILRNKIRLRWFLLVLLIVSLASVVFARQWHKIRKQHKIIKEQNQKLLYQNKIIVNQNEQLNQQKTLLEKTNKQLNQKKTLLEKTNKELNKQKTLLEKTNEELNEQKTLLEKANKKLNEQKVLLEKTNKELNQKKTLLEKINKELNQQKTLLENIYEDMHHRIKNNLRIIHQNFIEPAMENTDNPETIEILSKIHKNIISLKKLHMMLLDEKPNIRVPLADMVAKTIDYIENALPDNKIQINKNVDRDLEVLYKQAYPVILIINEFITNSYKHAFEGVADPQIDIIITRSGDDIRIVLKDNGKGMSEDIDVDHIQSKGLKLISSLVTELNGKLSIRNNNGFEIEIIFPMQF